MYVQVKSSNGITLIPEDTRLLADRRILIDGEINSELACGFMKRIILLSKENEQAISVIVNSPGGEVNSGLMIYDIIQSSHVPIKMYCAGRAYSMAALLLYASTCRTDASRAHSWKPCNRKCIIYSLYFRQPY